jgi:hypothetical protein
MSPASGRVLSAALPPIPKRCGVCTDVSSVVPVMRRNPTCRASARLSIAIDADRSQIRSAQLQNSRISNSAMSLGKTLSPRYLEWMRRIALSMETPLACDDAAQRQVFCCGHQGLFGVENFLLKFPDRGEHRSERRSHAVRYPVTHFGQCRTDNRAVPHSLQRRPTWLPCLAKADDPSLAEGGDRGSQTRFPSRGGTGRLDEEARRRLH